MRGGSRACRGALTLALTAACAGEASSAAVLAPVGHSQPRSPTDEASPPAQASATEAGVVAAEGSEPEPEPEADDGDADTGGTAIEPTPEDEALCRHITAVVMAESKQAVPPTRDQLDELIVSCALAIAYDRRTLDADEFRRRAACVRATDTVAGFSSCGGPKTPDADPRPPK